MKRFILFFYLIGFSSFSQSSIVDSTAVQKLEEVVVSSVRIKNNIPVAYNNISKYEISKRNLGQDLPILLNYLPNVVTTSDAGAGIGYTYMTIRGSDANRINITINGIPLNDSESQGVWWVNMPDFTSSVSNIQIQRGVGTSTNGGSAFGATVNLQTNGLQKEKYFTTSNTVGSFNTLKNNIEFGTGLLENNLSVQISGNFVKIFISYALHNFIKKTPCNIWHAAQMIPEFLTLCFPINIVYLR